MTAAAPASPALHRTLVMIGVRDGEAGRAARLIGFAFLMTAALVLVKSAQRGIFLASYTRDRIPDAFMVSAAALAATSLAVSALAPRLGVLRLVAGLLGGVGALLITAWVALAGGARWVPFPLYVVGEVVCGVLLVQGWGLITEALDVRSARRLLPLIGAGAGLAWVLGGLGTSVLAAAIGTPGLLVVATAFLAAAGGVLAAIGRRDLARHTAAPPVGGGPLARIADGARFVVGEPLLRLLAAISVLDLLIEQLVDFQLFAIAQERFARPQEIAGFMGQIYALTGVVTVVAPLVITGRLLARFGSTRCLFAAPAWALAMSAVVLSAPALTPIVALAAGDRMLKQALSAPGRAQMQAPLPAWRRAQAGALIRGVLAPLAYVGGAAALKLVPAGSLRPTAIAVMALSIGVVAVIVALRPAYRQALRKSLDRRQLELDGDAPALDAEQVAALAAQVAGDEAQAGFAVTLLASAPPALARPALRAACQHPSRRVRAAAVEALAGLRGAGDADLIARTLDGAGDDDLERACLRALASLEHDGAVRDVVRRYHDDDHPRVRALARASLARAEAAGLGSLQWATGSAAQVLTTGGVPRASRVGRFLELLDDPRPEVRAAAAWATGEVRTGEVVIYGALQHLLDDPVPAVRHEALRAAGRLGLPPYLPRIVQALADPADRGVAIEACAGFHDQLAPTLARQVTAASVVAVTGLAAALGRGHGPRGDAVLDRLLDHPHPAVRYRAAVALATRHHGAVSVERLAALLAPEVARASQLRALIAALDRPFLRGELAARLRQCEKRGLAVLALAADPALCRLAEGRLREADPRTRAQAIELIETAAPRALAAPAVALLEATAPAPAEPLAALLALDDAWLRQAAALELPATRALPTWLEDEAMLPLVEIVNLLRAVPLFGELSAEDLLQIARSVSHRPLPAGGVLFRKGEPGDAMYVVARGRVRVADGDRELALLGRGELIGELALLDGEARSADATAVDDSAMLGLAAADVDELLDRRPEIGREVIRVLVRRLRAANLR
ncbi:MAG: cyclic nucleotide-binding domain-containing protein [Myxococcales bacterium]|nr:cyclic nucleotide-binding domain-containing protein [Myxococcales bacterium]MBK7192901.1 cyclic nucleotide-binding domain-containing protein [Myxococcales bacterium]MBP6845499.1 cyclic nucleotide-binding domain-containing protein [Kofleriaceae bacterium]